jgi:hypothetical protein
LGSPRPLPSGAGAGWVAGTSLGDPEAASVPAGLAERLAVLQPSQVTAQMQVKEQEL